MRYLICLILVMVATTAQAQSPTDVLKDARFEYQNAVEEHNRTGKPLVVVLGASWCAPCLQYKADAIVSAANEIIRDKANYHLAILDYDNDREIAVKVLGDNKMSLPFTAIYYRNGPNLRKTHFYERHNLGFVKRVLQSIGSKK
jgi:thiol-disulfide isomerase/thioredoxin